MTPNEQLKLKNETIIQLNQQLSELIKRFNGLSKKG